ncbi:heme ABC transporter ATP-binding protein [Vibrio sp. Of7-15]|uniref:heme ABC transporter ATP-binding protein n=1 Tax=Vibrio sp. Of7-15 TaxID=2724879 RepID=UPI001EF29412|nr:heme ABC transporter ATP-binding protein [Vibrio sp. Of7-15]MCG7496637.1 heme ABC transporter ATP-binding protein [Vibrio sp. Of7-15]
MTTRTQTNTLAISASHLNLTLGGKELLNNVSLDIHSGQLTTLLGPNGAGKSSLLKLLCGEIPSDADIQFFGRERSKWLKPELAKHLGMLPQNSTLSFAFTVQEVVDLGALPLALTRADTQVITQEMMEKVEVTHLSERLYPSLSGGEKQRVHFARVLTQISQTQDQKILMLDEPTSALDLAHQHNTLKLARQMADEGAAVIVVLHDLNLAAQYSDRLIVLKGGKIQADGKPWDALTESMIQNVYGHKTLVTKHPIDDYPVVYAA